jgi:hypothetical protein
MRSDYIFPEILRVWRIVVEDLSYVKDFLLIVRTARIFTAVINDNEYRQILGCSSIQPDTPPLASE